MARLDVTHRDGLTTCRFHCPGCGHSHVFYVGGGQGRDWQWDGSLERPTFHPSLLNWLPGWCVLPDEAWLQLPEVPAADNARYGVRVLRSLVGADCPPTYEDVARRLGCGPDPRDVIAAQRPHLDALPRAKVCHLWLKAGRIEYLPDSHHHLAGQTIGLPDLE